jgi:hypothetical protein
MNLRCRDDFAVIFYWLSHGVFTLCNTLFICAGADISEMSQREFADVYKKVWP